MPEPAVFLHGIATQVPPTAYPQDVIGELLGAQLETDGRGAKLSKRVYRNSGIDKRHSVITDYMPGQADGLFFDRASGTFQSPSTGARNDFYVEEARPLFVSTAREALDSSPFGPDDVTHIVTASCTGFFAPGPDYHIARDLGLQSSVQRYHVGFMGCYAAFPALRMAKSFCIEDPNAVVLVVCLELCTLHLEPSEVVDNIIASAVFADGAAGTVVSARDASEASLELVASTTRLAPDSEDHMAWRIGDRGFEMVLSTYVPKVLGAHVGDLVDDILGDADQTRAGIAHWLIHPGGRAILDHVEKALDLDPDALRHSRAVLANYGNMSSATVLFVMAEVLASGSVAKGDWAYAMAFGPGLTVESALLRGA